MSEEPKYFDWIEDYLEGDMSREERERFEQELKTNTELAEELEMYQSIGKGIKDHYSADDLKRKFKTVDDKLDKAESEVKTEQKVVPMNPYRWFAVAAVVVVLMISGIVIYRTYFATSLDKIALAHWEEDKGLPVLMGPQNALDNAMTLYKEKRYDESLRELKHLLANHSTNDTLNYYAGVVSFKLNKYADAMKYFSNVPANSAFKESAEYREALTNLVLGNKDTAIRILQRITSNTSHLYHQQAKEILQSLTS